MPHKHPRSSRMAARRTNFTSKSDIASEGEFIHDEVSTISSIDDAPTHSAPSPSPTPSTPSSNSLKSAEKKSLAQIMATYGSSNPSSNPGAWGSGENTHSTPVTVPGAEEQFPRLHEHQRKHASTSQQSNKVHRFTCTTACNAKVFITTSTDSDPSSDHSNDRRQAGCCDSNLNANNLAGNRFKPHPSKPCCRTACIQHYAPSNINNSTSFQATLHSDRGLSQESGTADT